MIKHSEWVTSDYFRAVGLTVTQGRASRQRTRPEVVA